MSSNIERWARLNRLMLKLLFISFGLWYGYKVVANLLSSLNELTGTLPFVSSMLIYTSTSWTPAYIGYAVFGLLVLFLFVLSVTAWVIVKVKIRRDPGIAAAVNDEVTTHNWLKAFRFAYLFTAAIYIVQVIYVQAIQIVRLLTAQLQPISPTLLSIGTILPNLYVYIASMSLLGSFLFLDRDTSYGSMDA